MAQELSRRVSAVYVRIDTIEQKLKDLHAAEVTTEGYEVGYRIAAENLQLGLSVVADSCNSVVITRKAWENVAAESGAHFLNIEIICSDKVEYRRRIETRSSTVRGLESTTWQEVEDREYHSWSGDRIVIETAGKSESESIADLHRALAPAG